MNVIVPDMYQQSIYKINYKLLKKRGIKCICFDLDNTLASYQVSTPDKKLHDFITKLSDDFKVVILSNGTKERVRPFKEGLNIDASHSSRKPLKGKYKKIQNMYKFKAEEIACVGDQIMTDVIGANRAGSLSILVNAVGSGEPVWTKFNRFWEKFALIHLNKKGIVIKGEYYD